MRGGTDAVDAGCERRAVSGGQNRIVAKNTRTVIEAGITRSGDSSQRDSSNNASDNANKAEQDTISTALAISLVLYRSATSLPEPTAWRRVLYFVRGRRRWYPKRG
jgi:hypothetical protein